ncbi:MAG: site-2 protease family protein [Chloroflexi bacterium]|nr:site-2 protease family protein [Chloroflexota bacterium]
MAASSGGRRSPFLTIPGTQTVPLFRLFGIQFTANWSWLLLFALLVYVAFSTFRGLRLGFSLVELWSLAVIAAILSVASLYAHELAHALVARAYGIPVRTISLFLLGGMAHITRESPTPRAEFLIAIAGPASSLVIGGVAALMSWGVWPLAPAVGVMGLWLATMNIPLAIFNLLPAFPLDGGRVLRGLVWYAGQDLAWASKIAARVGQLAAVGLLFSGVWILFDGSTGSFGGLWLILIAWFMYAGAMSSQYATAFQETLRRLTVASVMDRDFGKVQAGVSVQTFAEEHLLQKQAAAMAPRTYAVYRDDYLVGLLSLRELGRIPMQSWPQTSIERAMQPIESAPAMEPSAPALGALHLILEEGVEHIAVMAEGRLLGLVTRNELARASDK